MHENFPKNRRDHHKSAGRMASTHLPAKKSLKRSLHVLHELPEIKFNCEGTSGNVKPHADVLASQVPTVQMNALTYDSCGDSDCNYSSSTEILSDYDESHVGSVWQNANFPTVTTSSSCHAVSRSASSLNMQYDCPIDRPTLRRKKFASASNPALVALTGLKTQGTKLSPAGCVGAMSPASKPPAAVANSPKPDEFLHERLLKDGYSVKTFRASDIADFFLPVTEVTVEGYDLDLVNKVRREDVDGLRDLMKSGRTMQCSNQFGESIVHMACRRESISVLRFLFVEANVSCKLVCDSGRTPLHDACWTSVPNFEVIRMLLKRCPDLLYITDKRGFTPMNYVRYSNWGSWCEFLASYKIEELLPTVLWNRNLG